MVLARAIALLPIVLGCSGQPVLQTSSGVKVETVASGLEVPWSIAWAPNGSMLFTERKGRVRVLQDGKLNPESIYTFPDVEPRGESGLMGMVIHPDFRQNHWMYFAYAYQSDAVRVVRFAYREASLQDRKVIVDAIPAATNHAGCRLSFGPDGKLYITTGDATDRRIAQRLDSLGGKTLRVNDDGTIPTDNPFVNTAGARPEIWSYGHRNSQGIAWQPGTGLMFQTEHGPSGFDGPGGGDEVNIVEKGKNYGWPVVHHDQSASGMISPLLEYTPAVAPSGAVFYTGDKLPEFKDNFFFAELRGEALVRVVLDGRKVVSEERIVTGLGRVREVANGPDGYLYFTTSNHDGRGSPHAGDDKILRLVAAK